MKTKSVDKKSLVQKPLIPNQFKNMYLITIVAVVAIVAIFALMLIFNKPCMGNFGSASFNEQNDVIGDATKIRVTTLVELKKPCNINSNCKSGICGYDRVRPDPNTHVCSEGLSGLDICMSHTNCKSGICSPYAICATANGGSCTNNNECVTGNCKNSICSLKNGGTSCSVNEQCVSGNCLNSMCMGSLGDSCTANTNCQSPNICGWSSINNEWVHVCTGLRMSGYGPCDDNSQCVSNYCGRSSVCKTPKGGSCTNNYECESNNCENGICSLKNGGTSCSVNEECRSSICTNQLCANVETTSVPCQEMDDNGLDFEIQGSAIGLLNENNYNYDPLNPRDVKMVTDQCLYSETNNDDINSYEVIEYYCSNGKVTQMIHTCTDGTCQDGACVQNTQTTEDLTTTQQSATTPSNSVITGKAVAQKSCYYCLYEGNQTGSNGNLMGYRDSKGIIKLISWYEHCNKLKQKADTSRSYQFTKVISSSSYMYDQDACKCTRLTMDYMGHNIQFKANRPSDIAINALKVVSRDCEEFTMNDHGCNTYSNPQVFGPEIARVKNEMKKYKGPLKISLTGQLSASNEVDRSCNNPLTINLCKEEDSSTVTQTITRPDCQYERDGCFYVEGTTNILHCKDGNNEKKKMTCIKNTGANYYSWGRGTYTGTYGPREDDSDYCY